MNHRLIYFILSFVIVLYSCEREKNDEKFCYSGFTNYIVKSNKNGVQYFELIADTILFSRCEEEEKSFSKALIDNLSRGDKSILYLYPDNCGCRALTQDVEFINFDKYTLYWKGEISNCQHILTGRKSYNIDEDHFDYHIVQVELIEK